MIKLVIFDLDGTLVDSSYDLADSANRALAENGYPQRTYEEYRLFAGNGTKKLIERALPESSAGDTERIHDIFTKYYREGCLNKTKPYDGLENLISSLKENGFLCACASNKPDEFSKHIVNVLFNGRFDLVHGKTDGVRSKPSPDIVEEILSALGVDRSEAIMVGDSDVDVATARASGLVCIGCEWGFRTREELISAGAGYVVENPAQILDIVKKL